MIACTRRPINRAGEPPAFVPRTTAERPTVDLSDVLVGLLEYRDPFFRGGSSFVRRLATRFVTQPISGSVAGS
jgi:hypothetical protein